MGATGADPEQAISNSLISNTFGNSSLLRQIPKKSGNKALLRPSTPVDHDGTSSFTILLTRSPENPVPTLQGLVYTGATPPLLE